MGSSIVCDVGGDAMVLSPISPLTLLLCLCECTPGVRENANPRFCRDEERELSTQIYNV